MLLCLVIRGLTANPSPAMIVFATGRGAPNSCMPRWCSASGTHADPRIRADITDNSRSPRHHSFRQTSPVSRLLTWVAVTRGFFYTSSISSA